MTYNQNITLDLNTNTSYVVVGAKQGDDRSRTITATILQNGESVVFADSDTASYRIRKPNGQANWGIATINRETNQVVIELDATDLAVPGRCQTDVLIKTGTELLGTANFIIDVQTAPNIAEDAVKSEAFQQLSQMVNQANSIIERAQAWTEGKRGSKEVLGDSWSISTSGSGNFEVTLDFDTFKEEIYPSAINEVRDYRFIYVINANEEYWKYEYEREGEKISDMSKYGIEITGTPSHNDQIIITASFADPTWHNNAKWYMEALKNASVGTVTTLTPGIAGNVTANYDDDENAFTFNFDLPSIKPHPQATIDSIDAFDDQGNENGASVQFSIEDVSPEDFNRMDISPEDDINLHKFFNFHFNVPRGKNAGFSDQQFATVNQRDPSEPPVTSDDDPGVNVHVVEGSPDTAKQFIFDFTIPPGKQGDEGPVGPMPTISCSVDPDPATQASEMSVTSTPTNSGYNLHFKLLKGIDGQGSVTKVMGISPVEDRTSEDFGNILAQKIFDLIYPLDSIYISVNKNFDPETTFGGEWEQIEDVYLYASSSDSIETHYGNINDNKVTIDFEDGFAGLGFNNGAVNNESGGVGVQVGQLSAEQKGEWALTHVLKVPATKGVYPLEPITQGITPGPLDNLVKLFGSTTIDIAPGALRVYVWKRIALSDGTRTTLSNQTTPDSNS